MTQVDRWALIISRFLAISYGFGAPIAAFLEYKDHLLSIRFNYSPELIYITCAVQVICAIGVLIRPFAKWAAAGLTVTTIGAIYSHFRINSPVTAIPALIYTALQIWLGIRVRHVP